jgi:large-conductance mechanosensitive channel
MQVNPAILAIIAVVLVALVIFIVIRNKKDKDDFVKELNAEESRPPSNKEDIE